MLASINAVGHSTPPLLIFLQLNYKIIMLNGMVLLLVRLALQLPLCCQIIIPLFRFLRDFKQSAKTSMDERIVLFVFFISIPPTILQSISTSNAMEDL